MQHVYGTHRVPVPQTTGCLPPLLPTPPTIQTPHRHSPQPTFGASPPTPPAPPFPPHPCCACCLMPLTATAQHRPPPPATTTLTVLASKVRETTGEANKTTGEANETTGEASETMGEATSTNVVARSEANEMTNEVRAAPSVIVLMMMLETAHELVLGSGGTMATSVSRPSTIPGLRQVPMRAATMRATTRAPATTTTTTMSERAATR